MESSTSNIPEELLRRFHDATDRLHAAREELERAMADPDYDRQRRVDHAGDNLRQAEHELEEIDKAIHDRMA